MVKRNSQDAKHAIKSFFDSKAAFYLLLFFAVILIFNDISKPGLASFDDCYYAEKGSKMATGGDLITPQYHNRKDFINPPFYFWMMALSFLIFGETAFAARFPTALCGFVTIIIIYLIARKIGGRRAGWWSAFFLSTSYIFLKSSRRAMMDVPFMMFATLSLFFLVKTFSKAGVFDNGKAKSKKTTGEGADYSGRWVNLLLFGLFAGLAGQIKSVFMIFLIGIPVLFFLITRKKIAKLRWPLYAGIILALVVVGWWFVYELAIYGSEFIDGFYGNMLSGQMRGVQGLASGPLAYIVEFARHFWLWLPLTLWALYKIIREKRLLKDSSVQFFALFGFFPLLVLSFAGMKYIRYVLFTFPPILILTTIVLLKYINPEKLERLGQYAIIFLAVVTTFLMVRPIDWTNIRNEDYIKLGNSIENKQIRVKGVKFHHYKGEYYINNNPMVYYTGHQLGRVIEDSQNLRKLIKSGNRFFLLVKKDDLKEIPKRRFRTVKIFRDRYLLSLRPIRSNNKP